MGTVQHYAYNRTKRSFLSLDVEVAATAPATLDEWFPLLAPRSGAGMWMMPFRGAIPSTGAQSPLDLVYLDAFGEVIDVVQSFPQAHAPAATPATVSVLALPALSIEHSQIETGDRLIVCAGQELEWRLKDDSASSRLVAGVEEVDEPLPIRDVYPRRAAEPPVPPPPPPAADLNSPPEMTANALPIHVEPKALPPHAEPVSAPVPAILDHPDSSELPRPSRISSVGSIPAGLPVAPDQAPSPVLHAAAPKLDSRPRRVSKAKPHSPGQRTPRIFEVEPNRSAWMDLPPPIVPGSIKMKPRLETRSHPQPIQFAEPPTVSPVVPPPTRPAEEIAAKDFALDEQIPGPPQRKSAAHPVLVPAPVEEVPIPMQPGPPVAAPQAQFADRALLSALDQLETRLTAFLAARGGAPSSSPAATPSPLEPVAPGAYRVIPLQEDNRPYGHYDLPQFALGSAQNQRPVVQMPGTSPVSFRADGTTPQPKWWERALDLDPQDPRKAVREPLDGLATFFWTGGIPKPHPIRDISLTGLYVVTRERWFPGTEIVMTLTKTVGDTPIAEHSLSLCTRAVRWGRDGVGLQFLLASSMGRSSAHRHMAANVDLDELNRFLVRLKASENQNSLSIYTREPEANHSSSSAPTSTAMGQD